jgi:hypothetical protein
MIAGRQIYLKTDMLTAAQWNATSGFMNVEIATNISLEDKEHIRTMEMQVHNK